MQLAYAFLSTFAGFLQDERSVIIGADVDQGAVSDLPASIPLHLVAKFRLLPDEPLEGHTIRIEWSKPGGDRETLQADSPLATMRHPRPGRASGVNLNIQMQLGFEQEGQYTFHLIADGGLAASMDFFVERVGVQ